MLWVVMLIYTALVSEYQSTHYGYKQQLILSETGAAKKNSAVFSGRETIPAIFSDQFLKKIEAFYILHFMMLTSPLFIAMSVILNYSVACLISFISLTSAYAKLLLSLNNFKSLVLGCYQRGAKTKYELLYYDILWASISHFFRI